MESLECRHVAQRPWAGHCTFPGLHFRTDAVGIMIKLSQKVMETGRVSRCVVKCINHARAYGDLRLHLGHADLVPKSVPLPPPT